MRVRNGFAAGYAEATKLTTVQNPLNPAEPPCPHFGVCGGCNYQNLQYQSQLDAKQQQVSESLQRIGGFTTADNVLLPIIPCQQPYHYRNNMQFTFSMVPSSALPSSPGQQNSMESSGDSICIHSNVAQRLTVGLHKANGPSEIIPIQTCFLQHDSANILLQAVAQSLPIPAQQLSAFSPAHQTGFLRQLILRRNSHNEYMVIISTTSFQPALLEPLVTALQTCSVTVLSIINSVIPPESAIKSRRKRQNKNKSLGSKRQESHVLYGVPTITEQLCGLQFQVSPESFFQVNSVQAEVLYKLVQTAAGTS